MFRALKKIIPLVFITELAILSVSDTRVLLYYLLISKVEIYQANYPRFWYLVFLFVKLHLPFLLVCTAFIAYTQKDDIVKFIKIRLDRIQLFLRQKLLTLLAKISRQEFWTSCAKKGALFITTVNLKVALLVVGLLYLALYATQPDFSNEHPLVQIWLSRLAIILILLLPIVNLVLSGSAVLKLQRYLSDPYHPYHVAMFRIVFFSMYSLGIIIGNINVGEVVTQGMYLLPYTSRVPIPWAETYSMHIPVTHQLVHVTSILFNISCICSFLGLFTRLSIGVHIVTAFYLMSISLLFGKVVNSHHMIWFPAILLFSSCGKTLSIDALIDKLINKKSPDLKPHYVHALPIKISLLMLGVLYFFPGFWKVWTGGFDWILSENLARQMYVKWSEENYWLPFWRIDRYPWLIVLSACFVIAFEMAFVFLQFHKRYRTFLFIAGVTLHVCIYLFMHIPFFTLFLVYPVLINVTGIMGKHTEPVSMVSFAKLWRDNAAILLLSSVLIGANVVYGFAKVNSWPFACYPTFDYVLPNESDFVCYNAYKNGKIILKTDAVKDSIFTSIPSYNLRALEYELINAAVNRNQTVARNITAKIFTRKRGTYFWDSVVVYTVKHPLNPDLRHLTKDSTYILTHK